MRNAVLHCYRLKDVQLGTSKGSLICLVEDDGPGFGLFGNVMPKVVNLAGLGLGRSFTQSEQSVSIVGRHPVVATTGNNER